MSARSRSLASLLIRIRRALPEGRSLPDELWQRRHRALLGLLWLHSVGITTFGLARGFGPVHSFFEGGVVAAIAFVATFETTRTKSRKIRAGMVALGLLTSSAVIVHLSGGVIEAHFHFFVMMSVLLLYEDWLPYLLAFGYVVLHHGIVGVLDPSSVFNHQAAFDHPWRWAAIHGVFISAAGVANVINWRLNEEVRAETRQARGRARESEKQFEGAFANAPIGVALVSPDGRWLNVNRVLCEMTGYTEDELLATTFQAITHPDHLADDLENVRKLLAGEIQTYETEKRYVHAAGHIVWVQLTSSLVRDVDGRPLYFISHIQDITERKQLEQALRQSQKMEAVGMLAGGIAHDFNNLLMAITGNSQLALRHLDGEGGAARKEIEEVRRAADRAASLTRQLLAFSRKQILQPQVLDLNAVVENMRRMLSRLIGEHILLTTELEPKLGRVTADSGQLEQVIVNLAVNARDAMPDGGTLTIETADIELDESHGGEQWGIQPAGPYVMLAVRDTGVGMEESTRARVFEPFFTTKPRGKGTGLGLATVYGIVKQSGGYVWVESQPGRGSTFRIYFPRVPQAVDSPRPAANDCDRADGTETILLVEDEGSVRTVVQQMLEVSGYKVLPAPDGGEAVTICKQHEGPIDLVVTDVVMPGMSGPELTERLRPLRDDLKVLYVSGYTDEAISRHGVLDPGVAFLEKPFTMDDLGRKVRDVLDA